MPAHERLGEGPVEPLDLTLHLRGAWVGVEVHDVRIVAVCLKMVSELASIVGLHMRQ